jgi:hypothetical protein
MNICAAGSGPHKVTADKFYEPHFGIVALKLAFLADNLDDCLTKRRVQYALEALILQLFTMAVKCGPEIYKLPARLYSTASH